MQYRPEIDGLRALAVVPVIFFHAGFEYFGGGFVGVDIFFVISGYLITSIIIAEIEKNKFSINNFYERRARRILPALSACLLVTSLSSLVLMPPPLLEEYSKSLISVATFLSNVHFYRSSDYFSPASEENPLLHTWSLSVEEQYYLFFPIVIFLLWPLGKKWVVSILAVTAVASLALAQTLATGNQAYANFYLIFSRAWELFFGSIAAFFWYKKIEAAPLIKESLSLLGLIFIFFSIVAFNKYTPYPSVFTLVPVLGTLMLILFATEGTTIKKLLSIKPIVFTGLLSYSLYLWHQPFFAFLRIKSIGMPETKLFFIAIIIIAIIAYLSWKYIEIPFRSKSKFSKRTIFLYSGSSLCVFIAIGLIGYWSEGLPSRYEKSLYNNRANPSPKRAECTTKGQNYLKPQNGCTYFGDNVRWAALGDSHVIELAYSLAKIIEPKNEGLRHLSFSGCPPIINYKTKNIGCSEWLNESLEYLENDSSINNVIVAFRFSYYFFGDQKNSYPDLPNTSPAFNFAAPPKEDLRELLWKDFVEIIERLIASNKTVYIVYPFPELPTHIDKATSPFSVFSSQTAIPNLEKAISVEYYRNRNSYILEKLSSLPYNEKLIAIAPLKTICSVDYCPAALHSKILYFDDNHLGLQGTQLLLSPIFKGTSSKDLK
ncbi:acyltransferase family protein [Porticoccus sp. GXU_MW_L64]